MNPDRGHGRMRTMSAGHTTGLQCEDISCAVISEKRKKREREGDQDVPVKKENQLRKPE